LSKRQSRRPARGALQFLGWWLAILATAPARASFLSGDLLDTVADWMALFVIFVVPCVVIVLFSLRSVFFPFVSLSTRRRGWSS